MTFAFGCEDLLDVKPISVITTSSMWNSEGDANGALNAMYSEFRAVFGNDLLVWGDCRGGKIGEGPNNNPAWLVNLKNNKLSRIDAGTDWQGIYTIINSANLILKYVPGITLKKEEDKNFILANAYFIRAFCYYWIARIWGDAPVITIPCESSEQENLYPTRNPAIDVFNRIEEDIEKAIKLFPNDNVNPNVVGSKPAAYMLKTDFYLWMAKVQNKGKEALTKAKEAIESVLANPNLGLNNNYDKVFRDEKNSEVIFALNYAINEATGGYPKYFLRERAKVENQNLVENPIPVSNEAQWLAYTNEFRDFIYNKSYDSRAKVNFMTYYDEKYNIEHFWINKYIGEWINETRYFTSNIILYRYAEAILFKAEIENALGNSQEAMNQLNLIAKRAYKIDDYYSGLSSIEIDEAILEERLREFGSTEGKTWFDFIRFGVAFQKVQSLIGRESEQNILLWPVSSSSINTNPNITQTPGYDK